MKKIAMKCTQEQFDAVIPRLSKKGFTLNSVTCFEKYPYLFCNVDVLTISNIDKEILEFLVCKEIHETWNEKIFLEACGIEIMKKPMLEEVKEYFKDAKEVVSVYGGKRDIATNFNERIHEWNKGFWFGADCKLWDEEKGFAKILTTKEKTFSITAGQLRQLTDPKLKEWFPEVFKVELEVGKWYKWNDNGTILLWNITEINEVNEEIKAYGFNNKKYYDNAICYTKKYFNEACKNLIEAPEQEVFEALKNEAEKRGYKKGNYKCLFINDFNKCESLKNCYGLKKDTLWLENGVVYKKGVWAEIIQTCTREEAEKLLNKKIID